MLSWHYSSVPQLMEIGNNELVEWAHIHTNTHAYTNKQTHTHTHTYTVTHAYTTKHARTHTHTHTHTQAQKTDTHSHTHSHTHEYTHKHIHTHIQIHTHSHILGPGHSHIEPIYQMLKIGQTERNQVSVFDLFFVALTAWRDKLKIICGDKKTRVITSCLFTWIGITGLPSPTSA